MKIRTPSYHELARKEHKVGDRMLAWHQQSISIAEFYGRNANLGTQGVLEKYLLSYN